MHTARPRTPDTPGFPATHDVPGTPRTRSAARRIAAALALSLAVAACGSDDATSTSADDAAAAGAGSDAESGAAVDGELFPDILDVVAEESGGAWSFAVTMSSPYDTPERYADGFRILGPDGAEYGFRLLTHDHANEQPFTRSLRDVVIPDGVTTVTVEGRDQVSGFGGATIEVALPGR